jgi:hypothetical protein
VQFTSATPSQKESARSFEAANLQTPPTQLVEATERAILFWLKTDPRSLNWWWNERVHFSYALFYCPDAPAR